MDRPGQTKGADIGSLGQQVVGDEKKELTKILKMHIHAMAWHGNCRTILVSEIWFCEFRGNVLISLNAPQRPRFGLCQFSLVIWLLCHFGFCKFGLVNSKTQSGFCGRKYMYFTIFLDTPQLLLYPLIWLFCPRVNSHWASAMQQETAKLISCPWARGY